MGSHINPCVTGNVVSNYSVIVLGQLCSTNLETVMRKAVKQLMRKGGIIQYYPILLVLIILWKRGNYAVLIGFRSRLLYDSVAQLTAVFKTRRLIRRISIAILKSLNFRFFRNYWIKELAALWSPNTTQKTKGIGIYPLSLCRYDNQRQLHLIMSEIHKPKIRKLTSNYLSRLMNVHRL